MHPLDCFIHCRIQNDLEGRGGASRRGHRLDNGEHTHTRCMCARIRIVSHLKYLYIYTYLYIDNRMWCRSMQLGVAPSALARPVFMTLIQWRALERGENSSPISGTCTRHYDRVVPTFNPIAFVIIINVDNIIIIHSSPPPLCARWLRDDWIKARISALWSLTVYYIMCSSRLIVLCRSRL